MKHPAVRGDSSGGRGMHEEGSHQEQIAPAAFQRPIPGTSRLLLQDRRRKLAASVGAGNDAQGAVFRPAVIQMNPHRE